MDGRATLVIEASMTITNCVIASRTSARFLARGVSSVMEDELRFRLRSGSYGAKIPLVKSSSRDAETQGNKRDGAVSSRHGADRSRERRVDADTDHDPPSAP